MKKLIFAAFVLLGIAGSAMAQTPAKKDDKAKAKTETVKKVTKPAPATKGEEQKAVIAKTKEAPAAKPVAKKEKTEATVVKKETKVTAPVKKDGTPDKRYTANKQLKKDGTPDKRYKQNKKN
jgi:hypothetical protein